MEYGCADSLNCTSGSNCSYVTNCSSPNIPEANVYLLGLYFSSGTNACKMSYLGNITAILLDSDEIYKNICINSFFSLSFLNILD